MIHSGPLDMVRKVQCTISIWYDRVYLVGALDHGYVTLHVSFYCETMHNTTTVPQPISLATCMCKLNSCSTKSCSTLTNILLTFTNTDKKCPHNPLFQGKSYETQPKFYCMYMKVGRKCEENALPPSFSSNNPHPSSTKALPPITLLLLLEGSCTAVC